MHVEISKISDKSNQLEELLIEAIGPGNTALKIKAITDNRNRTISEVRKILSEHNAKMVPPGSISWMFSQDISIDESSQNELSKLFEALDNNDDVEDIASNLKD